MPLDDGSRLLVAQTVQTFNALLEIAQAEADSFRGEWDRVDLSVLLEDLGGLYRDEAGNGLGLSLVKAVADLHGAELQLEGNQPGLRVTLLFNLEIVV